MAGRFSDILGTLYSKFQIGIGPTAVNLKEVTGKVRARNKADSADAAIVGSVIAASGDVIQINEDAAAVGADWMYTITRPAAGMAAARNITLPPDAGTSGFGLVTDGAGNTSWVAVAAGSDKKITDTTTLAFGSTAIVSMYTHPANAIVEQVQVVIDIPFNGMPTASVGISTAVSKYMGSGSIDLTQPAGTVFDVSPGLAAVGAAEALIVTYVVGGATAGSARILTTYVIPS